jgi:biotin transport system substrate-specific component
MPSSTKPSTSALPLLFSPIAVRSLAILLASLLLAVSAYVQVPGWPVKISMQTAAVFAIGVALGSRMAAASVLLYVAEGVFGLPVFQSGGTGLVYLLGPTAGYLLGFVLAAFTVGYASETGQMSSLPRSLSWLLAATFLIYLPGSVWLAVLFGWQKAIAVGVTPFLFGDGLKIALIATLVTLGVLRPLFKKP